MEQPIAWLQRSWGYVLPWLGFLAALIVAIRNAYAAERDRRALNQADLEKQKLELEISQLRNSLNQSDLEKQKLELEIARLRNSPETVADRRAIYERIRLVVREITNPAVVTIPQIEELHAIRHDCEFRFPDPIVASVAQFIRDAVELHSTGEIMRIGQYREVPSEEWNALTERHHRALMAIIAFEEGMVAAFKPHLSL